jgi:hypothetical protein
MSRTSTTIGIRRKAALQLPVRGPEPRLKGCLAGVGGCARRRLPVHFEPRREILLCREGYLHRPNLRRVSLRDEHGSGEGDRDRHLGNDHRRPNAAEAQAAAAR